MTDKSFEKINFKIVCIRFIKYIAMYPCTKSQLIWRISDFRNKLAQKNMNDKKFLKTNIKIVISKLAMYACKKFQSI